MIGNWQFMWTVKCWLLILFMSIVDPSTPTHPGLTWAINTSYEKAIAFPHRLQNVDHCSPPGLTCQFTPDQHKNSSHILNYTSTMLNSLVEVVANLSYDWKFWHGMVLHLLLQPKFGIWGWGSDCSWAWLQSTPGTLHFFKLFNFK